MALPFSRLDILQHSTTFYGSVGNTDLIWGHLLDQFSRTLSTWKFKGSTWKHLEALGSCCVRNHVRILWGIMWTFSGAKLLFKVQSSEFWPKRTLIAVHFIERFRTSDSQKDLLVEGRHWRSNNWAALRKRYPRILQKRSYQIKSIKVKANYWSKADR